MVLWRQQLTNLGSWIFLVLAGMVAGYAVVFAANPIAQAGGNLRQQQLICMLLTASLGLLYWFLTRRTATASTLGSGLAWLVFLLPSYALFQVLPLPLVIVRILSPARARLTDALAPILPQPSFVPLSVAPSATVYHCILFAACVVLFLVVHDIAWRLRTHTWVCVLPLLIIGVAEAGLGLAQFATGPESVAQGTYPIRNHYAGLLEMILPFATLYPLAILGGTRSGRRRASAALLACIGFGLAALILLGIIYSLSRMGLLASLGSMLLVALVALSRRPLARGSWLVFTAVTVLAVLAFIFLPPVRLILRFGEFDREDRLPVWRETLNLFAAYPLFGCGLGGYEAAFAQFKFAAPSFTQDYAHNDYLQYLVELGVAGFAVFAAPVAIILARLRKAWEHAQPDVRWLSLACTGSATAIGIHSFVDFNLYVPANALVLAWVLAIAAYTGAIPLAPGTPHRSRRYR